MAFLNIDKNDMLITEDTDGVVDLLLADELLRTLNEEELKEFLDSEECEALLESRMLKRRTFIRLSRADDLKRRKRLTALRIAKNKKDPLVKLYSKIIKQKFSILDKIERKYGAIAERAARKAQKEYYKKVPRLRMRFPGMK